MKIQSSTRNHFSFFETTFTKTVGFAVLFCVALILGYSCEKEIQHSEVLAQSKTQDPKIEKAKASYIQGQSRSGSGGDSLALFHAFQLNWGLATVETRDSIRYFVKVPIIVQAPTPADSVSADMIFYEDSLGIAMELWAFPSINTFNNGNREFVQNGHVAVVNNRYRTCQIFEVQNGATIAVDTFSVSKDPFGIITEQWLITPCPEWGDNFWENAGEWFKRMWQRLENLTGGIGGSGGSGGNYGGGGGGFSWSWLGAWVLTNSFNTGGTLTGGSAVNPNPTTDPTCDALETYIFNVKYSTDALSYFEDETHTCTNGCPAKFEQFEHCMIEEITGINYADHWVAAPYFTVAFVRLLDVLEQNSLSNIMAVDIFNACITFGASVAQMNALIALAGQNGAFDYLSKCAK